MHQFALAILDRLRTYLPTLCPLLLAAVLWLPNHPYTGFLNSDAEIYALSALHWLNPAAYAHDPFFMFGSQSDFTIFPSLYGSLIELCGLAQAAKIVMVLAAILWIGAAWGLARCVFDDWLMRTYAVLSMAIYSLNYSPNQATFVLNENYVTARVIAIPLTVMAITFSMERKWILAVAMVMLSVAIHPLLGI